MKLNGDEVKQLQRALISAFPNESALEQMVRFTFDENLKAVAGGENYSDTVFNLIIKIESQGRVEELVRGALKENLTNPELKAFSEKLGCSHLPLSQQAKDFTAKNSQVILSGIEVAGDLKTKDISQEVTRDGSVEQVMLKDIKAQNIDLGNLNQKA